MSQNTMYEFLLMIEQGHVQILAYANDKSNKLINELSYITRKPTNTNSHISIVQRHNGLHQLLQNFVQFKENFKLQITRECMMDYVNDEAKQTTLQDSMNRYRDELIRIKSEITKL